MLTVAPTADDDTTTGDKGPAKPARTAEVVALLGALAALGLRVTVRDVIRLALGQCWACDRDAAVGGAIFTNPAAVLVVARHPVSGSEHRHPACLAHAEDVIAEHYDRGRDVAVEIPDPAAVAAAA